MTTEQSQNEGGTVRRKKMALGRGIEALIPDIDPAPSDASGEYFTCDVRLIRPNPFQPRIRFSQEELDELSRSILEQGILQPLMVRKAETGYELIAGERRLRAARIAGLNEVPVVVKNVSDGQLLEISIIENIQREDLNALEEAEAYNRLMDEFHLTQEEVAVRVGKSRPAVANFLRLRQLPEPIKASILDGTLTMGHARAILGADTPSQQNAAWKAVIAKGLSVRETEALVKRLRNQKPEDRDSPPRSFDVYLNSLANDLSQDFGTRVKIKRKGRKGRVEIEFYNNDDLDRLIGLLKRT
ncbi:MAG: ParB/RepB/Spo0J family partition protein [Desulfatirhabdiaceae bacterium]|nr:ParB/RepB/Spo0J family partition protein [Desulfatirhabdiaceae bacterium]